MGGIRFYDFLLLHRFLGIREMVSLEHDPQMVARAAFNRPLNFIEVQGVSVGEFLDAQQEPFRESIYWFDYDGALDRMVVNDLTSLGIRAAANSLVFVTVYGDFPAFLVKAPLDDRLDWFQEEFGDLAADLEIDDMQNSRGGATVYKILIAALVNAFAHRAEGGFWPDFCISYADSKDMVTVGGFFGSDATAGAIAERLSQSMPFLSRAPAEPYNIRRFNLTERERHLFDLAFAKTRRTKAFNDLIRLGFGKPEIDSYAQLIRFIPRYVETLF